MPDQDAGSVMAFYFLKIFADLGHKVTFIPENLQWLDHYTQSLQQLGVECIYFPHYNSYKSYLEQYGDEFDIIMLFRAWTAEKAFDIVKKYCPGAKIIFETVDLHYLREEREAELSKSAELKLQAARTKAVEIGLMRKVDETILVSDAEMTLLKHEYPELRLTRIPLLVEPVGSGTPFSQRRDLVFIGGYQHVPNVDAMEFFAAEVWPLLKDRLPDARLLIVGSNMPEKVRALQRYERVVPVGFVPDIGQYLDHCRLTIAPIRFGAGMKGKIVSSGAFGVPTVATTIAAEGMELQDGYNILIGDTPDVFAEQVVRLYSDEALWNKLSKNIFNLVEEKFSVAAAKHRIADLLAKFGY
jgi:glycosyltransferase involved in cell wall biosynthesis